MTKCKECDAPISKRATKCPKCGAPSKRTSPIAMGCLGLIIIVIAAAIMNPNKGPKGGTRSSKPEPGAVAPAAAKAFGVGDTVGVGYTSYAVWKAWWSDSLTSNSMLDERPNAAWLYIDVTVRNNDKKARTIPPFKLLDAQGAEYDTSSKQWLADNAFSVLEDLNPGVSKQGILVFDVPKKGGYQLQVDGGFWSSDSAVIDLGL